MAVFDFFFFGYKLTHFIIGGVRTVRGALKLF